MTADSSFVVAAPDGKGLVAQMRPALVRYFQRKTGNAAEAEDLAQDVLVRALTHAASLESPAQAKGYIFRAAVNRWRDRARRLRVQGHVTEWDEATAQEAGTHNPPECVLIVEEELRLVVRALRELPERTRTVLMLIKLEQMKVASVAASLGISVRAVHKHLAKAAAHHLSSERVIADKRSSAGERPDMRRAMRS